MSCSDRLRKAWEYGIPKLGHMGRGHIYAPTRSNARYRVFLRLDSDRVRLIDIEVRRASHLDAKLPPLSPFAERLSKADREVVSHAYGGTGGQAGLRSHFVTDPGNRRLLRLALVEGLFHAPRAFELNGRYPDGTPDMVVFSLTQHGRAVAASMVETYPYA